MGEWSPVQRGAMRFSGEDEGENESKDEDMGAGEGAS